MHIHIYEEVDELNSSLAEWIADYMLEVLKTKERFTFVLSGGSTPKKLYELLSAEPYAKGIPWEAVHFFWGDERYVPFSDDRNNAKMAYEELLDKITVNPEHIHVMKTDTDPERSATSYAQVITEYFGNDGATFDLVLLGMGDDGHTLSLFPGLPEVHEVKKTVTTLFLDAQDMFRITLTAPVVNRAEAIVFAAVGAKKAEVLHEVLEGEKNVDLYPSQIISPINGNLHWFVDVAAAALLSK